MAIASASPRAAPAPRTRSISAPSAALIALTAAALIIRSVTLTQQSFWLDESYTVHLVRLPLATMLSTIPRTESTPPVYYVLAWLWTHVFGSGEGGLRSLSAVVGTATVFAGGRLAERLAGTRAALIAAALLAVSPLLVWFSQEARAYALAGLLSTLALICLLDHARSGHNAPLAGWAITAALALATHYFTAFVILPGALWLLRTRRGQRAALAALGAVFATAVALVPLALAQRGTGHADYISRGALGTRVLQVPKQLLIGYASPGQLAIGIAATVVLLAGAAPPLSRWRERPGLAMRLVIASAGAGVLLPVGLAVIGIDFLDTRNLLAALPPLIVLAAVALATARPRLGITAATVLAAAFALVVVRVDTHAAYQRTDWRGALDALGPLRATRILVTAPGSALLPDQAYVPSTRVVSTSATAAEIDVTVVAAGPAPTLPPGPLPAFTPPPGFRLTATVARPTFTVERFRAPAPTVVSLSELAGVPVGTSRAVLVQTPR